MVPTMFWTCLLSKALLFFFLRGTSWLEHDAKHLRQSASLEAADSRTALQLLYLSLARTVVVPRSSRLKSSAAIVLSLARTVVVLNSVGVSCCKTYVTVGVLCGISSVAVSSAQMHILLAAATPCQLLHILVLMALPQHSMTAACCSRIMASTLILANW